MKSIASPYRVFSIAFSIVLGISTLSGCGSRGSTSPAVIPPGNTSQDIVFRVQPGTNVAALAKEYGVTLIDSSPDNNLYRFRLPNGNERNTFAEHLRKDSRFSAAEPDGNVHAPEQAGQVDGFPIHVPFDYITTKDTRYTSIARAYSASVADAINPNASQQINLGTTATLTRGEGVTVAVLDTGVQADHPSLTTHLLKGYNALSPNATPNDVADGTQNQAVGHGTMVTGIIVSLAPDAKILPVRVLNGDGTGSIFSVVQGIRWAVSHGAKVLNLSFGTSTASGILQEAIQEAEKAGVTVIAAAGNAGKEVADYPSTFSGVLSVASVEANDTKSSYSNYGSWVKIAAPGTGITSTFVGSGYATWSGTSFAAPFVTSGVTLVRSAHPNWQNNQVTPALLRTTRNINSVNPSLIGKIGTGILDIQKAVTSAGNGNKGK